MRYHAVRPKKTPSRIHMQALCILLNHLPNQSHLPNIRDSHTTYHAKLRLFEQPSHRVDTRLRTCRATLHTLSTIPVASEALQNDEFPRLCGLCFNNPFNCESTDEKMPPSPNPTFEPQPHLDPRQSSGDAILSITRSSTTYTTTISLATSTPVASVPTMEPINQIQASSSNGPSTGVVVGAVMGSILGALVLITLFYKCCLNNRSAIWVGPTRTNYDTDSDTSRTRSAVGNRGGMSSMWLAIQNLDDHC